MANCGLRIDVIASSSPQRRPQAWLASAQAKQGGVCRKTAFSITQTTRFASALGPHRAHGSTGRRRACRGRATGANQIRVADTAEYVERERLPRDASREFRASLDVSVSADAGVGLAKRTENKRNKADYGPIEYCGRSDWSALIHRKDSAMTTATPTTPLSVNTWAISAAVKHTSSAPRGRGAAEF